MTKNLDFESIIIPRPGCGNGGLNWKDIKPIVKQILDKSWFKIIDWKE